MERNSTPDSDDETNDERPEKAIVTLSKPVTREPRHKRALTLDTTVNISPRKDDNRGSVNDIAKGCDDTVAKLLVVGDLHFAERSIRVLDYSLKQITETVKEHKPDLVVFLGDTLDRFGNINPVRQKEAVKFFYSITLLTRVLLLIGNHDIPNKTYFMCEDHGFVGLKYYWQNLTVVDTQCVQLEVNGYIFQAVPYCPNGMLRQGLDTLPDRSPNPAAIFCHQEIYGCELNDDIYSKEGDVWHSKEPLLICGHIHKYQKPKKNIWFIGSPHQDNFGEDADKSISLITFGKSRTDEQRIMMHVPKKITLRMTSKEYSKWKPDELNIYRIEVVGKTKRNNELRNCAAVKKVRSNGGKVSFIDTDKLTRPYADTGNRKVLKDVIAESIKGKDYLHGIYANVFI